MFLSVMHDTHFIDIPKLFSNSSGKNRKPRQKEREFQVLSLSLQIHEHPSPIQDIPVQD